MMLTASQRLSQHQALQNIQPSGSSFYTEIDTNITLNADGTTTPELQTGYYFLKRPRSISYIAYGGTTETDYGFNDGIFFYDSTNHFLKRTGINSEVTDEIEYQLNYIGSYNFWEPETLGKYDVVKKDAISSSITSSSTNTEVAGAKAVYDALQNIDNYVYNSYKSQSQVLNSIPASRK